MDEMPVYRSKYPYLQALWRLEVGGCVFLRGCTSKLLKSSLKRVKAIYGDRVYVSRYSPHGVTVTRYQ